MPRLSIIIPCYYNAENIPHTTKELLENQQLLPKDLEVEYIFVDDGSKDGTWDALKQFKLTHPENVTLVKLVANVGSYNAIIAGMEHATGDCNVVMAADLQDPPELIVEMYGHWKNGYKLVLGNRKDRKDPFLSKLFATFFQYMIRRFAIPRMPKGGFDFVLFDKELRDYAVGMAEKNTNILYMFIWLGYAYVNIPYTRRKRTVGKSRWTFSKKLKLFIDSFISFSYFPLRLISILGLGLGTIAFLYAIFVFVARVFNIIDIEGWTSLMVVILFVSSFQMIALGILGEYLWRVLDASRKRPMYIVEEVKK